jgi:hypothetical protein
MIHSAKRLHLVAVRARTGCPPLRENYPHGAKATLAVRRANGEAVSVDSNLTPKLK